MDNVDTGWCSENNIRCFNAGEANAVAVGEHTLAMLLALHTRLVKADREVRSGVWHREGNTGDELEGKYVAVIGYGNTGRAVAKRLSGFGVTVLAYDKYLRDFTDGFAAEATMEEVFNTADVISFHVPLTAETMQMVNRNYLQKFRKPVVLLNLSRGNIVNTTDLVEAMKNGKVTMAGLDVLEVEDMKRMVDTHWFEFLRNSERVLLSPHVAGWTHGSYRKIGEVLLQKFRLMKDYK
jgi:D-3-phosphoglycerate dehydrogenase